MSSAVTTRRGGPEGIVSVTFRNPPVNVLTLPLIDEIEASLRAADTADTAAILIRSEGPDFSAGVDVGVHASATAAAMLERFHRLIRTVLALEAVPVAVVQGAALGGGCELVLACDLVVASASARLGQPEIDVGCFPPVAAALLTERVGHQRAADMVYSGRPVSAGEAAAMGLVSRLAPEGGLESTVTTLAGELAGKSRAALRAGRQAMVAPRRALWDARLAACEEIYRDRLMRTEDMDEGVRAFVEKRPPRWRHR